MLGERSVVLFSRLTSTKIFIRIREAILAMIRIAADPTIMSAAELRAAVETYLAQDGLAIEFRADEDQLRAVGAAVLVASVKSIGSVLAAIVGAISAAAKGNAARKIILQGSKGARVEVPANTPPERIAELVRQAR